MSEAPEDAPVLSHLI